MVELFNYLAHLSSPTCTPKIVSVPYATHSPDSNIPEFSAWNCLHQVVTVIFMSLVQKSHISSFKWSKTGETSSWVWSTMNPGNWKTSYLLLKYSRWGRCETECEATISALTFHIWLPDMWIKPQFHLWSRCLPMYTLQAANDGSSTVLSLHVGDLDEILGAWPVLEVSGYLEKWMSYWMISPLIK